MSSLSGKRFVVTGAASGIGDAVARQLTAVGASVISLDRNEPTADVAQHIRIDLADPHDIDRAVEHIDGNIDGLINNAGVPGTLPGEVVLAVNLLGLRHLTEALTPRIHTGGSVVIVASTAGFNWAARLDAIKELLATRTFEEGRSWFAEHPQEGNAYDFSKEAAIVYTMSKAVELLRHGLRINAVLPGPVETPILVDFEESMGKDKLDGVKGLLGRHASPDDIAKAVLFMASEQASWINGHALAVDGGITAAALSGTVPMPA